MSSNSYMFANNVLWRRTQITALRSARMRARSDIAISDIAVKVD
jgi:hypothetical protein